MPDPSSLYPQPPQQNQGLLQSDPTKLIGALQGLQSLRIQGAQAPALMQQPAAALQGQNISNQQQQQALSLATRNAALSSLATGVDPKKATPDDIYSGIANFMKSNPNADPSIVNAAGDVILKAPSIKEGISRALNIVTPPDAGLVDYNDPNTGQPMKTTRQQANTAAIAGPGGFAAGPAAGGSESAQAMVADQARQGTFGQDIYPLQRALDLAQKLGPGGMAPGSKGRQEFESFVYGLTPQLVPAGMQDKIKNYAELEKYLVNNASQRAQNLGPHTNDGLAAATTGSPNVHINDLAGVDLIKAQIGLRRMEYAQVAQASKAGGANYLSEKAKFAPQQDPRAYMADMMTPDQIKKLHMTLTGADRAKFNSSYQSAISSGAMSAQ